MFNQLSRRKEIPVTHAPLRIRQARHDDAAAVLRLAALDSSRVPSGDVLLAEVGDGLAWPPAGAPAAPSCSPRSATSSGPRSRSRTATTSPTRSAPPRTPC